MYRESWKISSDNFQCQNAAVTSNKHWKDVCGLKASSFAALDLPVDNTYWACLAAIFTLFGSLFIVVRFVKKYRAERRRLRLQGDEVSHVDYSDYGSIPRSRYATLHITSVSDVHNRYETENDHFGEHSYVPSDYYPEQPRWFL